MYYTMALLLKGANVYECKSDFAAKKNMPV